MSLLHFLTFAAISCTTVLSAAPEDIQQFGPEASDVIEIPSDIIDIPCDLAGLLSEEPELSISAQLLEAYTAATAIEVLQYQTAFLPTNDAWAAAPEGTVQSLLRPENLNALEEYLAYASTYEYLLSADFVSGDLEMNNGESILMAVEVDGFFIENGVRDSQVVIPDIVGCDAVIHGMDMALFPGSQTPADI
ncbi:hypothetical protein SARC_06773 [Sphaeroforma arctica JP610]|uniref:FAS1 domain-containing protein n=1 Tax=Sphaeroforma arctica JP610 TaxID=667725 RepID=A0A0L0FW47_9EUKA|nr:hypothetical protein SARC_06773 [Sphaeroforma arctica JP610]KNC80874.1 hypothetical protein SARC_06773 [Sphaeroforma arctica JP610]|eukprot:XP_014154776.1 hypothetical protein SARC_06773 [Sphaeroforma arctica JP610]